VKEMTERDVRTLAATSERLDRHRTEQRRPWAQATTEATARWRAAAGTTADSTPGGDNSSLRRGLGVGTAADRRRGDNSSSRRASELSTAGLATGRRGGST